MQLHHSIAIVGIGGIFPGAPTLDTFWKNIEQGISAVGEVPLDRWPLSLEDMYDPIRGSLDKVYSKRGCYVSDFEFDTEGLNLDPALVKELDPVFHFALHAAREALRDAELKHFDRQKAGVIIGNIALPTEKMSAITAEILGRTFEEKVLGKTPPIPPQGGNMNTHPLNHHAVGLVAGLITKALNLGGGSYTIDGACAASLYALNYAVAELLAGRADVMLTGGVCRPDSAFTQMGFSQLGALSPTGVCAPFDEENDGLVVGEGAGMFVLKRLKDALHDDDHIYAIIRGIGLSNDRRGNLLAPDSEGQLRAMQQVYEQADWKPQDVDLIECHATGTPVGDAIEFSSLKMLWGDTGWTPKQCVIGGVKSNVGHLLTGAGAAGLMKTVLALKYRSLPPTANFSNPGPKIDPDNSPFDILTQAKRWQKRDDQTPRRAAVSAFGFGGINAHVLLEEWEPEQTRVTVSGEVRDTFKDASHLESPPIAIIGMEAHFGPWKSLGAFQERVLGGGDSVEPASKTDWWGVEQSQWFGQSGINESSVKGYFIDKVSIPIGRFRIPPKELQESLAQQLLMLQVTAKALEDAGFAMNEEIALHSGVFIGIGLDFNSSNFSYRWRILDHARTWAETLGLHLTDKELESWAQSLRDAFGPPLTANRTVGALGGIVASRIAREFKVGGPGITISSEENSGLQALHVAVRSLQQRNIDHAIVGAVDLHGDIRSVLSTDVSQLPSGSGESTFPDLQVAGHIPGEGAAAVVLKRLEDAVQDGNTIYGVIKGIGTASGENSAETTSTVYRHALERACHDAHVDPLTIQYLEISDAEAFHKNQARRNMFSDPPVISSGEKNDFRSKPSCALGSVKADIGYTGAASGLASLVKTCLCLDQEILPPLRNFPPSHTEFFANIPSFYVPTSAQYWLRNRAEGPRRAGVSSFSVDGGCVYVVVEGHEKTREDVRQIQPLGARTEALFLIEGEQQAVLLDKLDQLQAVSSTENSVSIEQIARKWWQKSFPNDKQQLNLALIAKDTPDLQQQIEAARHTITTAAVSATPGNRLFYEKDPIGPTGEVAFVFPGSGNHYPGMGRDISAQWPEILRKQDLHNQYLRGQYIPRLLWNTSSADIINRYPQEILLGQVAYSTMMTDLLQNFGIRPQAVIGYSLGESSAFFAMKAWNERDEMLQRVLSSPLYTRDLAGEFLAVARTWDAPAGRPADWSIAAVQCPAKDIREVLKTSTHVYLLIINTPDSSVIGGDRQAVMQIIEELGCNYHLLSGVSAAHCEIIKQVEQPYRALHYFSTTTAPKGLRFYSGAWHKTYDVTPDSAAEAILAQASDTINFPAVVRQAYRDGVRVFIEIGPGNSCTNMISKILEGQPHVAVSACASNYENVSTILRLLGKLSTERIPVDLSQLYGRKTQAAGYQPVIEVPARKMLHVSTGGKPFQIVPPQAKSGVTEKSIKKDIEHARKSVEKTNDYEQPRHSTALFPEVSQQSEPHISALIQGVTDAQASKVQAHEAYFKLTRGLTQSYTDQLAFQMSLIDEIPRTGVEELPTSETVFMNREQCLEFARGSIAKVLGERFAEFDTHPTRVRLPDEPLMLVDRIISIEGEPCSLTHGRVITEHDVLPDAWYLDCGRIPTCIAVESGQADLFLSGYLGIDFVTNGLAVYRLLDATVTFHSNLPGPGTVIRHDIHIDEFFRQGNTHLFRFHFESTIDGELFLTMTHGCAGFFRQTELNEGRGLVFTKMDLHPMPGKIPDNWQPLVDMAVEAYSDDQLEALRRGDLATCFGSQFAHLALQNPCRLPGGRMKLVDRILNLDPKGGRYGLGQVRGEADIHPGAWFLTCHFADDQVMPGTLMYECCLHTLRVLLMRMGWVGEQDGISWEPVPGIEGQLKCRGQVIATTKKVLYEISLKEIGFRPEPYAICDAIMFADGKPIVRMIDMALRLSGMTKEKLEKIWDAPSPCPSHQGRGTKSPLPWWEGQGEGDNPQYQHKPALFDSDSILAFSNGKPSEAFGDRYKIFDGERVIARLPGPPYQFLDRITEVTGEQWIMSAGHMAEAQYDVPPDEWYFSSNRNQNIPFAVLLEIVLQPCGWLAAYSGSALSSEIDLSFRNLGGKAAQFLPIGPDIGTLTTVVNMTNVSSSGGMIIQHYNYTLTDVAGQILYQGSTYFGFFTKQALTNQVGLRDVTLYQPSSDEIASGTSFPYPQEVPFPDTQLRMVDHIDLFVADGGPYGLGFIRGTKTVKPEEWFFNAHFYQDPVWPGSLGLEAFLQLLKVVVVKRWGWQPGNQFETMVPDHPHQWTYRGQVIPTDQQVTIQAVITALDDSQRFVEAEGHLIVDERIIYHMQNFTIKVS